MVTTRSLDHWNDMKFFPDKRYDMEADGADQGIKDEEVT